MHAPQSAAVLSRHGNVMYRPNLEKRTRVTIKCRTKKTLEVIITDGISNIFRE